MAVTSVTQKSGRKFTRTDAPELSGTKVYYVHCSDKLDTPDTAADALPQVGASWSATWPGLVVKSVEVDEHQRTGAGGVIYLGTVQYSSRTTDPNKQNPDPTAREGVLRLSFENTEEPISQQYESLPLAAFADGSAQTISTHWGVKKYGKAICSSIGKPYEMKEDFATTCYTFEKNVQTTDWAGIADRLESYVNRVNSDAFSITYRGVTKRFLAHTVLLTNPSSEPSLENGIPYERISVTLKVRADGWARTVLDQGFAAWLNGTDANTAGKQPKPILDDDGEPISQPAMLDGNGLQLLDVSQPVFLTFRTKAYADFRILGFPEFGA